MEFKCSRNFPQKKKSGHALQLLNINMFLAAECGSGAKLKRMAAFKGGKNGNRAGNNQDMHNEFKHL